MKKIICLISALLLCMSLFIPAMATENEFVPSITYKDGPEIIEAKIDEEDVTSCVTVTSIKKAEDKTTDITQEERDKLLEVYNKLTSGEMKLPLDGDYTIRDLVDVSFEYEDCRCDESHGNKDECLKDDGVKLTVVFDMDVNSSDKLKVLVYIDGEWVLVEDVTINEDGTVTVDFEDICPVVFCVESKSDVQVPTTGDEFGRNLGLWIGLLAVSAAALVVMLVCRRKIVR